MRKLYSIIVALFAFIGIAQAQVTIDPTALEWSEATDSIYGPGYTATSGSLSISYFKATSSNTPVPVSQYNQLRIYKDAMLVIAADKTITSVTIKGVAASNTNNITVDGVEIVKNGATLAWTGAMNPFVATMTGGQTRVASITVGFDGDSIPVNPVEPDTTSAIDWTSSAIAPMRVSTLLDKASQLATGSSSDVNVYVTGRISQIKYTFSANYGTAQFSISDDGQTANDFLCYGTYYLGNRAWVEGDTQIAKGDTVIVCGIVTNYNGTLEMANKKNYLYSLNGITAEDEPYIQPEITEYTAIEDMQAAAHALGTATAAIKYSFNALTVTGVKNSNIYVTDGQHGLLLYGSNSKSLKVGDVIAGTITGQLQLYNGVTELGSADFTGVAVVGDATPAEAVTADIAAIIGDDTKLQYESMLVRLEDVNIAADTIGNYKLIDESDNEIILYDNYGLKFAELGLDETATYNVTAIVGSYKGTIQLYPRTASDFVKTAEAALETPVSGWNVENVVISLGDNIDSLPTK